MNEVSCKAAFEVLLVPLAERGVSVESLVEGTEVLPSTVRNKKARINWTDFVTIMAKVAPHFTEEEFREIGRTFLRSSGLRYAVVVGRLLYSPKDFYRWFMKPREGVGNQFFTCVYPTLREISAFEIEVDLTLPDDFPMCWEFFVTSAGNFEELPAMLGQTRADVELTRLPNGARYRISMPKGIPVLARLRRWLTWPFTVRAAARELQSAHETLLDKYEELERAREKLDHQARLLRIAHRVNDLLLRELELERLLESLVATLTDEGGFAWIRLSLFEKGSLPARETSAGTEYTPVETRLLESGGGDRVGRISVAIRPGESVEERDALLALIVPTLATGIQNAIYRTELERRVEERTAELKLAHDQLESTVAQLREAQTARERFFGNISHEIRTPLTMIMLAAADIQQRSAAVIDQRSSAGLVSISEASRKLVRLVDELLLLAAGQEGKLRIHPEPTDLVAMLRQLVSAWTPLAEQAKLELQGRLPERLSANVDPVAIERVTTNLVSNAVKYTPKGGSVEIELAEEPDGIRISVLDTGPGIGEELAQRLFGRFERSAGEDRRKVGTGIGLSIVKQLVEAHGGSIEARQRPEGGAELRVLLPRTLLLGDSVRPAAVKLQLGADVRPTSQIATGARLGPKGPAKGTIVLAEDDVLLAEQVAKLLSNEYVVLVAHDGITALELVRSHQPQLLITDVEMPEMNGIELAKAFAESSGDKVAPVIILSAVIDLGTRLAGLDAGAVDYITKPFEPFELQARVRAQLRMRDMTLRLHKAEQLSSLGILTTGLAHELRNPANGIVNAIAPLADLLPEDLMHPDNGVRQLVDVIRACAEQIGFLSRQLLGFRRGEVELDIRSIPVAELIDRSVTLAQRSLSGVDLRKKYDPALEMRCAPPLMTQVLTNLIENAGHAAGRGGWVEVNAGVEDGRFLLSVSDSGGGVPLEMRERIFEPFFTTKPVGVGTGLGLSVARDIIHRHGGTLEVRDGAEQPYFVIDLPRRSVVEQSADAVS